MLIEPIPALTDNYLWLLRQDSQAAVVDPGDAAPVIARLAAEKLSLVAILVTHHHADHVAGIAALVEATGARVWGPASEDIPGVDIGLAGGESFELLGTRIEVIAVPGHTAGHIAYWLPQLAPPALFCGDTLFAGGCGRIFEGTPEQMLASLDRLAALPAATRVCCAHEYTVANLRFARAVEPDNAELAARLEAATAMRARGEPTLPSTLGLELATNPFLRSGQAASSAAAAAHGATEPTDRLASFTALRAWKNNFR